MAVAGVVLLMLIGVQEPLLDIESVGVGDGDILIGGKGVVGWGEPLSFLPPPPAGGNWRAGMMIVIFMVLIRNCCCLPAHKSTGTETL